MLSSRVSSSVSQREQTARNRIGQSPHFSEASQEGWSVIGLPSFDPHEAGSLNRPKLR